ncbi:TPA: glycoside hydrolase family 28 protein [Klebsiella variicola subsp. variicola]|uniref:glycoside hydrolase family 28 protein n=1 Tax=Klebsiella variicola TaxID=244366 RepID=UPI0030CA2C9A|nr:glycoside hydrolase family 28 protein [Klebsiella variicola]
MSIRTSRTMLTLSIILAGTSIGSTQVIAAEQTFSPAENTAPLHVMTPPLSADDKSIVLIWEKPPSADKTIVDYVVYRDGVRLGTARKNQDTFSPAKAYIDNFYNKLANDGWAQKIDLRTFTAVGLQPDHEYTFVVRALYDDGTESSQSTELKTRTTTSPHIIDIKNLGAKGDGKSVNTEIIQHAIDDCTIVRFPQGCKVLIADGVYKTGALFLHSDMTLEIDKNATLLGSDDSKDYPLDKGYYLYHYKEHPQPLRPPSLINTYAYPDKGETPPGTFKNIRIVGSGIIDGNGWQRGVKPGGAGEITDELGDTLPQYRASNANNIGKDGILARNQTEQAVAEGEEINRAYKNRRSSLMTMRGVDGFYIAGLTVRNPAFHGIMVLGSKDITANGLTHQTFDGNNADGIEFGNSQNSIVFNNVFNTGDDSVNFAAGFGKETEIHHQKAQSGAWIFNNYFRKGHGAIVTGSHTGAWIEKIRAEDNVMYQTDVGLRMKSRPYYGGGVREVVFRNNAMKDIAKEPFIFTIKYSADVNDTLPAQLPAQFKDVLVENITVDGTKAKSSILVDGMTMGEMADDYHITFPRDAYHQNLHFYNVQFRNSPPTDISFLRDSEFNNVTFLNTPQAWQFANVEKISVQDNHNKEQVTALGDKKIILEASKK